MGSPAALTGPFVAEAAARGVRPPLRLVEHGVHGWQVGSRARDAIVVDEYGDLWWARTMNGSDAHVVRPLWPEEFRTFEACIEEAIRSLRARL